MLEILGLSQMGHSVSQKNPTLAISENNNDVKNAFNNLRFTTLAAVIKKSSSNLNDPSDTTVDIHGNSLGKLLQF